MGGSAFIRTLSALLALSAIAFASSDAPPPPPAPAAPPPQTIQRTLPLSGFRAVAICAPVAVLITDAPDGKTFEALVSGPAPAVGALAFTPTRHSLQVETAGSAGFVLGSPLTVELRLPPGILSYVERVHAPGDTVIAATWDPWQAEVSSSAQGGVIVSGGMGAVGAGASAKVSLAGPGPAIVSGPASRWEVFAGSPGGAVHVSGPTKYVVVKVDGGASVTVAPASDNVTVAGWVGAAPGTTLFLGGGRGDCQAHSDAWTAPPRSPPGAAPPPACGAGSAAPPSAAPAWTCGVEVRGDWACGGGGRGAVPSMAPAPCGVEAGAREMRAAPAPAPPASQPVVMASTAAAAAAAVPVPF